MRRIIERIKPQRRWMSSSSLSRPRGMVDLTGSVCEEFAWVESQGRHLCKLHGFEEVRTPIVEFTQVFDRSLGEGSDVVSKEMYTFLDKSSHSLTLRPEGTAGVARALFPFAHQWGSTGHRVFYHGPMFRYERPQKGRQRQFTQFGVEALGVNGISSDIQVIQLGKDFLQSIGLLESTTLLINTLGDEPSRAAYADKLKNHFENYRDALSPDSLHRLDSGRVLRILDSKHPDDQGPVSEAPTPESTLSADASNRFHQVLAMLQSVGVDYTIDPLLVRGLDYYSHTIFEFVLKEVNHGSQRPSAVLAGGRYDGLAKALGFKGEIPAVGWAAGIERLCLERERLGLHTARAVEFPSRVFVLPLLEERDPGVLCDKHCREIREKSLIVAEEFRRNGYPAQVWGQALDSTEPIASQIRKGFRQAERQNCNFVAIVGRTEAECESQFACSLKNLASGEQVQVVSISEARAFLLPSSSSLESKKE